MTGRDPTGRLHEWTGSLICGKCGVHAADVLKKGRCPKSPATAGDQFGHLVKNLEDAMEDKELPSVLAVGQIPPEAPAMVRCWRCKHDVPEDTTVCNAGVGTQCKDSKACRGRWYGPTPAEAQPNGSAWTEREAEWQSQMDHLAGKLNEVIAERETLRSGSRSPERVRRERFELMSAVVAKAGGAVTLTDLELVDACGYHLERIDHMMGGITLRVPSMVPMAAPCASQEQTSGAGVSDFAPADTTTPAGVPGEAGIYSNMTDAVRAAFVSCAPPLPPGTTFITTTTSTAGPSSSLEERATAWVFREADDGRDDVTSLAALLADVRHQAREWIAQDCEREARGLEDTGATTTVPDSETLLYIARRIRRTTLTKRPEQQEKKSFERSTPSESVAEEKKT